MPTSTPYHSKRVSLCTRQMKSLLFCTFWLLFGPPNSIGTEKEGLLYSDMRFKQQTVAAGKYRFFESKYDQSTTNNKRCSMQT